MGCDLARELIDEVIEFHGHWCPGLAIGIRAGEWALHEMGRAGDEEDRKILRERRAQKIMEADFEELYRGKEAGPMPAKARVLESLRCESCGETAMESRTHRLLGRILCRPCFRAEDSRGLG